jgi:DNA polymerase III epsilon subunit-like protein
MVEGNISMIFDTETTGLIPKIDLSYNWEEVDISTFPYILQLSFVTINESTHQIQGVYDELIKLPEGFVIDPFVTSIHGITNEMINKKGRDSEAQIDIVMKNYIQSKKLIGHNVSFDITMLLVAIIRILQKYKNMDDEYDTETADKMSKWMGYYENLYVSWRYKYECTMKPNVKLCNIWVNRKNSEKMFLKFPKLAELHYVLFHSNVKSLHNSLTDVFVCLRCYYFIKYKIDLKVTNKTVRELYKLIE